MKYYLITLDGNISIQATARRIGVRRMTLQNNKTRYIKRLFAV